MAEKQVYVRNLPNIVTEIELFTRFTLLPVPVQGARVFYTSYDSNYGFLLMYNREDADRLKNMKTANFMRNIIMFGHAERACCEKKFTTVEEIASGATPKIFFRPKNQPLPSRETIEDARRQAKKQLDYIKTQPKYRHAVALSFRNSIAPQLPIWKSAEPVWVSPHPAVISSQKVELKVPVKPIDPAESRPQEPVRPTGAQYLENQLRMSPTDTELRPGLGCRAPATVRRIWNTEISAMLSQRPLPGHSVFDERSRNHGSRLLSEEESERTIESARAILAFQSRKTSNLVPKQLTPEKTPDEGGRRVKSKKELGQLVFLLIQKVGPLAVWELNESFQEYFGYPAKPWDWFSCTWLEIVDEHPELSYDYSGTISPRRIE